MTVHEIDYSVYRPGNRFDHKDGRTQLTFCCFHPHDGAYTIMMDWVDDDQVYFGCSRDTLTHIPVPEANALDRLESFVSALSTGLYNVHHPHKIIDLLTMQCLDVTLMRWNEHPVFKKAARFGWIESGIYTHTAKQLFKEAGYRWPKVEEPSVEALRLLKDSIK